MYIRDLYIQTSEAPEEIFEKIFFLLKRSDKLTQIQRPAPGENSYILAQPEELLMVMTPVSEEELGVPAQIHLRFQPYNLPDPVDQQTWLSTFPEAFVQKLTQAYPQWKLDLRSLTKSD